MRQSGQSQVAIIFRLYYIKINCRLLKITLFDRDTEGAREIKNVLDTLTSKYKSATTYIDKILHSADVNHRKMSELLQKHEDKYSNDNSTFYMEHSFDKLWSIQSYAYDYYFFVKKNFLVMDYFSDIKKYLSYYIRAIFCTYSSLKQPKEHSLLGLRNHFEQFPLGAIEVDMIVKYAEPKNMQEWIKKYKVVSLTVDQDVDVVSKFESYCESFDFFGSDWNDQLFCFVILISKIKFSNEEALKISSSFIGLVERLAKKSSLKVLNIFSALNLFATEVMCTDCIENVQRLLTVMIIPDIVSVILERHLYEYQRILARLAPFASQKNKMQVYREIDAMDDVRHKCQRIFAFRKLIPKRKYKSFLKANIAALNCDDLFHLVYEKYIPYCNEVQAYLLSIIDGEISKRKGSCVQSHPDWIKASIDYCILLKILGNAVDLSKLEPYKEYSDYLAFLLSPGDFDYSRVDTNDYMWCNFFRKEEYVSHFYLHRNEILSDDLEKLFANGFATMNQQKINSIPISE